MGETVAVASTVYNLAGLEEKRPHYLKSLILGGVMQEADSLGEVIAKGYGNGPGIRLRNFARWARNTPKVREHFGITRGEMWVQQEIDLDVVQTALPPGQVNRIDLAEIGSGNILYWAQRHLAVHSPHLLDSDFTCEYQEESNTILITHADGSTEVINAADYDPTGRYLYVRYTPILAGSPLPVVEGPWLTVPSFPDLSDWIEDFSDKTNKNIQATTRTETRITYSDGRPTERSSSISTRNIAYQELSARYHEIEYQGRDENDILWSRKRIRHLRRTGRLITQTTQETVEEDLGGGVTRTSHITTHTEELELVREIRTDTQRIEHSALGSPEIFIYRRGTGNTDLDQLFVAALPSGDYFPVIPLRYKNKPITKVPDTWTIELPFYAADWTQYFFSESAETAADPEVPHVVMQIVRRESDTRNIYTVRDLPGKEGAMYKLLRKTKRPVASVGNFGWQEILSDAEPGEAPYEDLYKVARQAFRRAIGDDKYNELLDTIGENESVKEIDYAYAAFGVALNVKENSCRKYIYKFFQNIANLAGNSKEEEDAWWEAWTNHYTSASDWDDWWKGQRTGTRRNSPQPSISRYPALPERKLEIASRIQGVSDYRNTISWAFIREETGTGLLRPEVKRGDLWYEKLDTPASPSNRDLQSWSRTPHNQRILDNKFALCWQETSTTWRRLIITGLVHRNYIYKSNAVVTTAKEALADPEESPFLVPLHEEIFAQTPLVDRTQLATASCFLVLNAYETAPIPWWASGWFKVLLVVVVVVIAVSAAIITGGTSLGLLGTAASVGASVGASGTLAIIVGAAVNALAGLMVSFILMEVASELLGDTWGRVIGTVVMAALTFGAMSPGGWSDFFTNILSVDGLVHMTPALGDAGAAFFEAETQNALQQTQEIMSKAGKDLAELQRMYDEEFSTWRKIFPQFVYEYIADLFETPDQFRNRTLMVGSDIIEANLALIHNFTDLTVHTKLPGGD